MKTKYQPCAEAFFRVPQYERPNLDSGSLSRIGAARDSDSDSDIILSEFQPLRKTIPALSSYISGRHKEREQQQREQGSGRCLTQMENVGCDWRSCSYGMLAALAALFTPSGY